MEAVLHRTAVVGDTGASADDALAPLTAAENLGTVYLLHFDTPVSHARHYLGWAANGGLFKRLAQHEAGNGASTPLLRALKAQGGTFQLARTWRGVDRNYERSLKNRGGAARLCPLCKEG